MSINVLNASILKLSKYRNMTCYICADPTCMGECEPKMNQTMKPCPFCGHEVDLEDDDTLYPNGFAWTDRGGWYRTYHRYDFVPQEQWCYSMHCVTTAGGCGAEIHGDSRTEAIEKWNRRV